MEMEDNQFFDKYTTNLDKYYNSDIIIKAINDGITNIPPSMETMFLVYRGNRDDIQTINQEYYDKYLELMAKVKERLFSHKTAGRDNTSNFKMGVENTRDAPRNYYEEVNEEHKDLKQFLNYVVQHFMNLRVDGDGESDEESDGEEESEEESEEDYGSDEFEDYNSNND